LSKLGFALVGLDHWYAAFSIADALGSSAQAQIVAVADRDGTRAEQVARERGVAASTTDDRAAIERDDVDVVVAMYSSERNAEVCRAAAAAGKHIIGVKPMALDLAGADSIVAAVRAAGVHYLPYECIYRLAPEWRQIKGWLEEGRIGRPLRYTQTLHTGLPKAWPESGEHGWWLEPGRVPGGGWLDHAIYAVDLARWLFGSEPQSVQSLAANLRHAELPFEDYGAAIFRFASGAVALIEDTWTADPGFWLQRSEVVGTAGAIFDESRIGGALRVRGDFGSAEWSTVAPEPRAPDALVGHMVACVRGEATPVAAAEDGRANLAACLAFYEAARTGGGVSIAGAGAAAHQ
jgi:predicted dehydrogenase